MAAQFPNAVTNRLRIPGIATSEALQPVVDPESGLLVAQTTQPIPKNLRLEYLRLSLIKDSCISVKVIGHGSSLRSGLKIVTAIIRVI